MWKLAKEGSVARRSSRRTTALATSGRKDHCGFDRPTAFIREAAKALPGFERELFSLRTDSNLAQLALIRAGAGIGMCQVPLARRGEQLVRILPGQMALHLDTWITMHEDLRNSPRCRAAFDALVAGMQKHAA